MATAKITLFGMYKWMQLNDDDLFSGLTVPTGINKQTLINTILTNGGEFETLYADANFMKDMIGLWSDKWQRTMQKWYEALSIDYNPLENYDRMEEWSDNKLEHAVASDASNQSGSGNVTNQKSAYDGTGYQNHDKADSTSSGTNNATTNTVAQGSSTHGGRTHGNIGVTTSQQMLQAQLDVVRFNLYNEIADVFLMELCIYTY